MLRRILAGAFGCWLVLLGPPATAGAAAPDTTFTVEPLGDTPQETERGWFTLEAGPGDTLERTLRLRNTASTPVALRIAAVDAATADVGGVAYGESESSATATGAWLALDRGEVGLAAGEQADVVVRVRVPIDATAGDHLAGVAVWAPASREEPASADGGFGAGFSVQTRRVVAVQIGVPGAAAASLAVTGVRMAAAPDGAYLMVEMANDGGRLTRATGRLSVASMDFETRFRVDTFVPGTAISYPVRWPSSALPEGADVRVELDVEGGEARTWTGALDTTRAVREELEDRRVDRDQPSSAQRSRWLPSMLVSSAAVAAATFALLGSAAVRRRRLARRSGSLDPEVRVTP